MTENEELKEALQCAILDTNRVIMRFRFREARSGLFSKII